MKYVAFTMLIVLLVSTGVPLRAQTLPGHFTAAFIEGTITALDTGKPIVGAKIDVVGTKPPRKPGAALKASNDCGAGFAMSALNGSFVVGVGRNNMCISKKQPLNGTYSISISKRGYLTQQKFISVNSGSQQFVLIPAGASVQGQIIGPDGNGLPYAKAFLMKNAFTAIVSGRAPKGHIQPLVSEVPMVRADKNGNFTIPVSPGDYVVMAGKAGYTLTTKSVNPLEQQYAKMMMQHLPPNMPAKIAQGFKSMETPQLGEYVHVVTGGVATARLNMEKSIGKQPIHQITFKSVKFTPFKMALTGSAKRSPNNVLFFTAKVLGQSHPGALYDIVRSRTPLASGQANAFKSHIKTFNFLLYGFPGKIGCRDRAGHLSFYYCVDAINSFTDTTGKPGVSYYYYIFEYPTQISPQGALNLFQTGAPSSNALRLITQ